MGVNQNSEKILRWLRATKYTKLFLSLQLNITFAELERKFDNDKFSDSELLKIEKLGCKIK